MALINTESRDDAWWQRIQEAKNRRMYYYPDIDTENAKKHDKNSLCRFK